MTKIKCSGKIQDPSDNGFAEPGSNEQRPGREYNTVMLTCRKIEAADDKQIAKIIRANLEKFHLDIPGTVYFDPELDHLSDFYSADLQRRVYYIALGEAGEIIGGAGAVEFSGFPDCAELQKLYLTDSEKGKGYGKELVRLVENWARSAGYRNLYLETHTNLAAAMKMYGKLGFHEIEKPASVVHGTMDHFFIKEL